MNIKDINELLNSNCNALEEICCGLRHVDTKLSGDDIERIEKRCIENLELLKVYKGLKDE